jgi:hypothetical protein
MINDRIAEGPQRDRLNVNQFAATVAENLGKYSLGKAVALISEVLKDARSWERPSADRATQIFVGVVNRFSMQISGNTQFVSEETKTIMVHYYSIMLEVVAAKLVDAQGRDAAGKPISDLTRTLTSIMRKMVSLVIKDRLLDEVQKMVKDHYHYKIENSRDGGKNVSVGATFI